MTLSPSYCVKWHPFTALITPSPWQVHSLTARSMPLRIREGLRAGPASFPPQGHSSPARDAPSPEHLGIPWGPAAIPTRPAQVPGDTSDDSSAPPGSPRRVPRRKSGGKREHPGWCAHPEALSDPVVKVATDSYCWSKLNFGIACAYSPMGDQCYMWKLLYQVWEWTLRATHWWSHFMTGLWKAGNCDMAWATGFFYPSNFKNIAVCVSLEGKDCIKIANQILKLPLPYCS